MIEIAQIDAFAERPFAGNPAAVCLLERERDAGWMQSVAAEMALSETAFLRPREDGSYGLRWFTPAVEVDLCGHATLASAHWLWEAGRLAPDGEAVFHTRSGRLAARRAGEWIEMDFPADPPRPAEVPPGVAEALGADPVAAARSRLYLLLEVAGERELSRLAPDFHGLRRALEGGVVVTCAGAGGGRDFLSR
ncbi:MAG: PhzF family phenazine biosynthesis protein, partial [Thermoanaerobaculia bacterium]|nr:PhzF family phenazine biosynthesis protein [Thermoanaerobaculia bacterium]